MFFLTENTFISSPSNVKRYKALSKYSFFGPTLHVEEPSNIQYDSFHLHEHSAPLTLGMISLHLLDDRVHFEADLVSFGSIRIILCIKHTHPVYKNTEDQHVIIRELPFDEGNAGSFKMIPEAVLILLLAVAALLEGRPDIPTVLVRSPAIYLCVTDDA